MTYSEICEAKTRKQMKERLSTLLSQCAREFGGTRESHIDRQLSNIGYFSGYYDSKTMERVKKWIGAKHPVFDQMIVSERAQQIGSK